MKTTHLHIVPECYVDTNLVQMLMQVKGVNHQHSCGQVTNTMQNRFGNGFSVGVVDNDKKQSKYSKECLEIAHSNELILCQHPGTHHYLIKINNIMETFILNCANELGLSLDDLGIKGDIDELKSITKDEDSLDNPKLRKILKAVSHANEMNLLAEVLNYLDSTKYNASSADLQAIFASHGF